MVKRLVFPTFLIVFGAVAGYLVASDEASTPPYLPSHKKLMVELESENAVLKAQVEELKKSRADSPLRNIAGNSVAGPTQTPTKITTEKAFMAEDSDKAKLRILQQKIALIEVESFVDGIAQQIARVGHTEFIDQQQQQFLREAVDPVWAQSEEESIYEIFLGAPELADVALVNAECKSLQCRVSLSVATTAMSNEAVANLSRLLAKDKGNLYHWVNYDPQKNITEVYLSTQLNSFNSDGLDGVH